MWKNIKQFIDYSEGGIVSKEIIKDEKISVTLFCMAKSTQISEHTSTKQGVVFVVEGNGVFNLEGEAIEMLPDVLIHMPANAVHSLRADEDTSFLLILCQ